MLCRVALVRIDVSEERIASIIRLTRINDLVVSTWPILVALLREDNTFLRNVGLYIFHTA
jgi:hypothetical protein